MWKDILRTSKAYWKTSPTIKQYNNGVATVPLKNYFKLFGNAYRRKSLAITPTAEL